MSQAAGKAAGADGKDAVVVEIKDTLLAPVPEVGINHRRRLRFH